MSHSYRAVLWNRQKRIYDVTLAVGALAYLVAFVSIGVVVRPQATIETWVLRGSATLALLLLHVILSIGPLSRLDRRFLPLLYNRRHLGVTMFLIAALHGGFAIVHYHALGDVNPVVSVLSSRQDLTSLSEFPFVLLGIAALGILFLMAATSHDFWLANLTAPTWKALHMLVYVAYGCIVLHVALGVLQDETSPVLAGALGLGFAWVVGLHAVAAVRERDGDRELARDAVDGFVPACAVNDIPEGRARIVCLAGERIAIFRYDGKVAAVSNACQHQNGPLGEGKIVDGCITCPWHGYQYRPEDGASPPPFTEKVPTFSVRVQDGVVWVDPRPHPPGTRVGGVDAGS